MTNPSRDSNGSKLVIITHEFAPFRGGAATYTEELAAALQRAPKTFGVEVWAPNYCGRALCDELPFPVVRLRAGGSLRLRHECQFARQLWTRRAQLEQATVLLTSVGAHKAFSFLASLGLVKCRRVWSLLHGSEVRLFVRHPFWRFWARRFYPRVQRVFTASNFTKSLIDQSFLSPLLRKIILLPCAGSSAAAKWVTTARPSDGKIRILTLARVDPRKGQLDTARALALLPPEMRAQVIYQVGGAGSSRYLRQVEQTCRKGGIEFEYLGEVSPDALPATYQQCDLYAMTSRALSRSVEGFGITYLDAGFHGKPVVGYRTGGVAEAVVGGETGLLVEEGDLPALANAFTRLITDPHLRQRLGEGGRRHAARFSWDATARIVIGIMEETA